MPQLGVLQTAWCSTFALFIFIAVISEYSPWFNDLPGVRRSTIWIGHWLLITLGPVMHGMNYLPGIDEVIFLLLLIGFVYYQSGSWRWSIAATVLPPPVYTGFGYALSAYGIHDWPLAYASLMAPLLVWFSTTIAVALMLRMIKYSWLERLSKGILLLLAAFVLALTFCGIVALMIAAEPWVLEHELSTTLLQSLSRYDAFPTRLPYNMLLSADALALPMLTWLRATETLYEMHNLHIIAYCETHQMILYLRPIGDSKGKLSDHRCNIPEQPLRAYANANVDVQHVQDLLLVRSELADSILVFEANLQPILSSLLETTIGLLEATASAPPNSVRWIDNAFTWPCPSSHQISAELLEFTRLRMAKFYCSFIRTYAYPSPLFTILSHALGDGSIRSSRTKAAILSHRLVQAQQRLPQAVPASMPLSVAFEVAIARLPRLDQLEPVDAATGEEHNRLVNQAKLSNLRHMQLSERDAAAVNFGRDNLLETVSKIRALTISRPSCPTDVDADDENNSSPPIHALSTSFLTLSLSQNISSTGLLLQTNRIYDLWAETYGRPMRDTKRGWDAKEWAAVEEATKMKAGLKRAKAMRAVGRVGPGDGM